MDVLITGGAGLIGSHLASRLLEEGHEITVVDNLSRGSRENLPAGADLVEADLTLGIPEELKRSWDRIYHLAAYVGGVKHIHAHQREAMRVNLLIDTNVIDLALETNARLLYMSTACVYPTQKQTMPDAAPLKEVWASPANPEGTYGWAKLTGEKHCQAAHEEYGLEVAIPRCFNVYGPGEDWSQGSHVIPELIRKALRWPEEKFLVYGDGKQVRAFTYVEDAVEGIVSLMEKWPRADPVNIGSMHGVTILRLAENIAKLCRPDDWHKMEILLDPSEPRGVLCRRADNTKAKKVISWSPRTSLMDGLKRTIEWYRGGVTRR